MRMLPRRWARAMTRCIDSALRLTSLIRHDYSLYPLLSLATELLTADVPVATMAPRTWARPEKSAAGFHFGFRNGWNFGGAIGDKRRACQSLPVEFPSIAGTTAGAFPTRLNPALKSDAFRPSPWLLPSRATSPVSWLVSWLVPSLVPSLVFWPGPRRVSPGTCRICSRAA